MSEPTQPAQSPVKVHKPKRKLARKHRVALAVLVGTGIGALCPFLPPHLMAPCAIAAKILSAIVGSP